jgi:hypothetical protein
MITAPSISDLYAAISANYKSQFGISTENDLKRVLTALATNDTGLQKLFYIALLDVQKNMYPDLADSESMGGTLERYGRIKLFRDPYPATQGLYTLTVTGVNGTVLNIGSQFKNQTTGYIYTTTESVSIVGSTAIVRIMANTAGSDSELSISDNLFLINSIINIDALGVIESVITIPTDTEDINDYRALVLEAYRLEPNGGSSADYISWSKDVAGVKTVYPVTTIGASGSGSIYVELIIGVADSINGEIPNTDAGAAIIKNLWFYDPTTKLFSGVFEINPDTSLSISQRGRRPLGFTNINVMSCVPIPVNVTISGLKDSSPLVRTAISSQIINTLNTIRPFVSGVGDPNNPQDTLYLKDIILAVDSATLEGNVYNDIGGTVDSINLNSPYQFLVGKIPYLNEITYS